MTFVKKLKVLDILPADPTRVTIDRITEVSIGISRFKDRRFISNEIYEGALKTHSKTTILSVISYLRRIGLLNKVARKKRIYTINQSNKEVNTYFNNLAHNRLEESFENLKHIFLKFDLFDRVKGLFEEKKIRSKDELFQYFKQIESNNISDTTIDRKVTFLCMLLDRIGLVHYNQEKQELLWKNGISNSKYPLSDLTNYLSKPTMEESLKKIEFEGDKIILTFNPNSKISKKEFLSKIIKEM